MKFRRVAFGLAAAVAVAGVAGFAALEVRDNMREQQNCSVVQSQIRAVGEVVKVSEGKRSIAVLGDSYSAGDVLADRKDAWTYDLGRLTNARVSVAGVGMTGYTNGGYCKGQEFRQRVGRLVALKPDVLIIQGGLNDWEASPESVQVAARDLLRMTEGVPNVTLVGPTNAPARANLPAIDAALAKAAEATGRDYISALGWDLDFLPDRLHLTPAGHDAFAKHVAAALG